MTVHIPILGQQHCIISLVIVPKPTQIMVLMVQVELFGRHRNMRLRYPSKHTVMLRMQI